VQFLLRTRDSFALAPVLAAFYPTVFALSNNWYSISQRKVLWLLGASLIAGALVAAASQFMLGPLRLAFRLIGVGAAEAWSRTVQAAVLAVACITMLFVLLQGTLLAALVSPYAVGAALGLSAVGTVWLFVRGRQRYFSSMLVLLILVSGLGWLWRWVEVKFWVPASARLPVGRRAFEHAKFVHKPNIYLFIYDAYGSREVYQRLFHFDNSPHYDALERRGFTIAHTFSNYRSTWPTTLSIFSGEHHYYEMSAGVDDTRLGRALMAGLGRNPLLETMRRNGYRVQYIHGTDYFVSEQGVLDFVFPQEPVYGAMRVYGSPLVTSLARNRLLAGTSIAEQTSVILSRLPDPRGAGAEPWFTFAHVNLPSHSPRDKNWLELKDFEQRFVERTRRANAHSLRVIDRIRATDPHAIIVITGDHGAWRYRDVWSLDEDPNRSFQRAGVSGDVVSLDIFGTMIAVHSNGRCDDYVYAFITPVNIMRTLCACLANDRGLLEGRAEDIAIFRLGKWLFLVARDGRPLPRWERLHTE
jgi:hypothetical protein